MTILFVCSGNTCRSPMACVLAEKIFRDKGEGVLVRSAGLWARGGEHASAHAVASMTKLGLSLKEHRAHLLTQELLSAADLVLTMTASHKEEILRRFVPCAGNVYSIGEFTSCAEDVPDPFGGDLPIYEECARSLLARLEQAADKILREWIYGESENTRSSVDPT